MTVPLMLEYREEAFNLPKDGSAVGRQSAGAGFMRAIAERENLSACTAHPNENLLGMYHAGSKPPKDFDGVLFVPSPDIAAATHLSRRPNPNQYSVCGITHTLSDAAARRVIREMLYAPVMPHDRLICTSEAARSVIYNVVGEEYDYARWRLGDGVKMPNILTELIPLGVHTSDFADVPAQRDVARKAFKIADHEVVLMSMGRYAPHGKSHPHALFVAAQKVACQTGRAVTLLLCGWGEAARKYEELAKQVCPMVRVIMTDSRSQALRMHAWAAADIFVSLADSLQETFGLTLLEAMACGLPILATDWSGYRDTVTDGVEGFLVPTSMPVFLSDWDHTLGDLWYHGLTSQVTVIDQAQLTERMALLVSNPELRKRMGAGGLRTVDAFDWKQVLPRYECVWTQQQIDRKAASSLTQPLPKAPALRSPVETFGEYPSNLIDDRAVVTWLGPVPPEGDDWFGVQQASGLSAEQVEEALEVIKHVPLSIRRWDEITSVDTARLACVLAKAGVVHVSR